MQTECTKGLPRALSTLHHPHCITHGLGEVDFRLWSTWEPAMTGVSIAASAELDLLLVLLNQMQDPSSREVSLVKSREPPSMTFRSGAWASSSGISKAF